MGSESLGGRRPPGAKGNNWLGMSPARSCPREWKGWQRSRGSMGREKQREGVEREGGESKAGRRKGEGRGETVVQLCRRKMKEAEHGVWHRVCGDLAPGSGPHSWQNAPTADFPLPSLASQRYVLSSLTLRPKWPRTS